jgi:predicted Zn-dependent protease
MAKGSLKRIGAGALLAVLLAAGCYTVPETGRKALMLVPEAQMNRMGVQTFQQIKREEKVSTDREAAARVERVGQRIARVSRADTGLAPDRWELTTFASDQKNAFALPGGKIGVYEGILEVARTDAELATVMGHEVAHVAARHGGERMSELLAISLGGMALSQALRDRPEETRNLFLLAYGVGTQVGRVLPHNRQQELEADRIGLMYMARAGYDPRAAIRFWERMEETGKGGGTPAFLSTHPSHGQRIDRLERWLPEALEQFRAARREGVQAREEAGARKRAANSSAGTGKP